MVTFNICSYSLLQRFDFRSEVSEIRCCAARCCINRFGRSYPSCRWLCNNVNRHMNRNLSVEAWKFPIELLVKKRSTRQCGWSWCAGNWRDRSDVRGRRAIVPLETDWGVIFVLLHGSYGICFWHPTLHTYGGENCSPNGPAVRLFIRLFGRPFLDAGFAFVPFTILLRTWHITPTSDLEAVVLQYWREYCHFDVSSGRLCLRYIGGVQWCARRIYKTCARNDAECLDWDFSRSVKILTRILRICSAAGGFFVALPFSFLSFSFLWFLFCTGFAVLSSTHCERSKVNIFGF